MRAILSKMILKIVWGMICLAPLCAYSQTRSTAETLPGDSVESLLGPLAYQYGYKSEAYSSIRVAFDLNNPSLNLFSKGGGGGVDGGGGNVSGINGQLLDLALFEDIESLPEAEIRKILNDVYGVNIARLQAELPGFKSWLEAGLSKPWYLDQKTFDSKVCQQGHRSVCLTEDAVRFNKDFFMSASSVNKANAILRALVHVHTDIFVEEIASQIASSQVRGKGLYESLVNRNVLPSASSAEASRKSLVAEYQRQLNLTNINQFIETCQAIPLNLTKLFNNFVGEYMTVAKKCAPWVRPEIDGVEACSIEPLAKFILNFKASSCLK